MRKHLSFIAVVALLQACATSPSPPGPRPPDLTPIDTTESYVHEPSHAMVPAEYGGFRRVGLYRRGPDGQRLTASFAGGPPQCLVAITLFLDPAEESGRVDKSFTRAKGEVMHAYPSAVLDHEDSRTDPVGRRAYFTVEDKRMEVGVVQTSKGWDVKHRAVSPAQCAEQARDSLNRFFIGWQR